MSIESSIKTLTLGDLAFFEEKTGQSISNLDLDTGLIAQPMIVLAALMLHRSGQAPDRDTALGMAADYSIDEATALLGLNEDTEPAGE